MALITAIELYKPVSVNIDITPKLIMSKEKNNTTNKKPKIKTKPQKLESLKPLTDECHVKSWLP